MLFHRNLARDVREGVNGPSMWSQPQGQDYLASDAFVANTKALVDNQPLLMEVTRAQRRALARSCPDYANAHPRNEAIVLVNLSEQQTMSLIAQHFDVY